MWADYGEVGVPEMGFKINNKCHKLNRVVNVGLTDDARDEQRHKQDEGIGPASI